jgi:hypothetical protein
MAIRRHKAVAAVLTRTLLRSAGPNPTACHMSRKFWKRGSEGSQAGGAWRISARGLSAVETMTAKGKRTTTRRGERRSQ